MARIIVFLWLIVFSFGFLNAADKPPLLETAKKELNRSFEGLQKEENPPYFISYHITDKEEVRITASFGKLKDNHHTHNRILDIDLRVGDHKFDNTHIIRGQPFQFGSRSGSTNLPLEDHPTAIRNVIWNSTDIAYKSAIERFDKALTNKAVKVEEEDTSADFSHEKPYTYYGDLTDINPDPDKYREMVKRLSAKFAGNDWLYSGEVIFMGKMLEKYFVSTEGAEIQMPENYFRIYIRAKTKADDGMSLPIYESYFAFKPEDLPSEEKIAKDIDDMIKLLNDLRKAPKLQTTYSGPAILSGEASGVFFHEILGHRVEGHREKDPSSSQTFKHSIGKEILPEFIDVIMDPTKKTLDRYQLSGYYPYDDQGIKAEKVVVAKDGKFQNFLMSRSPIENFKHSNGHGRKQAGYKAVSRQSNLIVEADEQVSEDELKEMLREKCEEEELEYGLYFDIVQGGFTFTGRSIPNAFNVNPLVVYKVYTDGRPDKLLRGVDLIGTPLTTFSNIEAAADNLGVFNGICGAESGGVPVSACSPSLFVSKIEVQKKAKSQAKPPILPAPKQTINPNQ